MLQIQHTRLLPRACAHRDGHWVDSVCDLEDLGLTAATHRSALLDCGVRAVPHRSTGRPDTHVPYDQVSLTCVPLIRLVAFFLSQLCVLLVPCLVLFFLSRLCVLLMPCLVLISCFEVPQRDRALSLQRWWCRQRPLQWERSTYQVQSKSRPAASGQGVSVHHGREALCCTGLQQFVERISPPQSLARDDQLDKQGLGLERRKVAHHALPRRRGRPVRSSCSTALGRGERCCAHRELHRLASLCTILPRRQQPCACTSECLRGGVAGPWVVGVAQASRGTLPFDLRGLAGSEEGGASSRGEDKNCRKD
mmetsp:Transcript_116133/g.369570  ORF Transcript_116133/g.369570 Transcript_116133/m.369570 type:complete len:308 (-) Transcript_116133:1656-2579(-)